MYAFIFIVVLVIFIIIIKLSEKSKNSQTNTSNYSRKKEMENVVDDIVKKNIINNDIRIVNESEIIIEKTNNPDTKISRCVDMLEAMKRLKKYQNSGFVKINNLEEMSETYNNLLYELKSKKEINLNKEKALDDLERPRRNYNNQNFFWKAADRYGKGIKYEKQGKIDKAIELYKMSIKDDFEYGSPYNRLMILYRRKKDYINEIRIIEKYISVFDKENNIYLNGCLEMVLSNNLKERIYTGSIEGTVVKDDGGKVIYNPNIHSIIKYKKRLEKAKKLLENQKNKEK